MVPLADSIFILVVMPSGLAEDALMTTKGSKEPASRGSGRGMISTGGIGRGNQRVSAGADQEVGA